MDTANRWPAALPPTLRYLPDPAGAGAPAVVAERLGKAWGKHTLALNRLSFSAGQGEFFGLVGPHGAGKTTLMRILATLSQPDAGRVKVLGYDLRTHAREVRRLIGYMGQATGIDLALTGYENVRLMARLHGLKRHDADRGTDEVLARLELSTLANCKAALYSPSARKRLALACALVHRPRLLLLDDPTGGVPPHEQAAIWQALRAANEHEETTIFLATHHLEEAETICQRVAILDGGKLIAYGTPAELKAQVTGVTVTIYLRTGSHAPTASALLERVGGVQAVWPHPDRLELEVTSVSTLPIILRLLEEHEVAVREATLSKPSLEEVFFRHTGRKIRDSQVPYPVGTGIPGGR